METFSTYIDKGGLIFTFLFSLSILTIAIVTYKVVEVYILRSLRFSKMSKFLYEIGFDITLNDLKNEHLELIPKSKRNFFEKILQAFISKNSREQLEIDINFLVEEEFKKIQSLLPTLEVISQVSPLIGLLGTVIGMIDSFNELELGGSLVDPSILAGGIWTALLTTAMGLIVAIPALISHYFLEKEINNIHSNLNNLISKLSDLKL
jgi:biopolymer transport protein ExbB